jgi:hypothetical protein
VKTAHDLEFPDLRIGVFTADSRRADAAELFELFKVPWAFARGTDDQFPAALVSTRLGTTPDAKLVIYVGSQPHPIDERLGIKVTPLTSGKFVTLEGTTFPIHTDLARLDASATDVFLRAEDGTPVGVAVTTSGGSVVRIGYDLFDESSRLLSAGQSSVHASSPSLELHIEVLRTVLLANGLPVVEILPQPEGHPFTVCLTHDIDFIDIRNHVFDHTFFGFTYRVFRSLLKRPHRWAVVAKNFRALLSVPAVHLRLIDNFWFPMTKYSEAEGPKPSTYFFIPFAGRAGRHADGPRGRMRAAPYDVTTYASDLQKLEDDGREVAVHGIDAWCDEDNGREERAVIERITHRAEYGVRMHWLFFSDESPRRLENAGFAYDSTLGYNDAVGYRNGTTQVFRPQGASKLLELPLNVQDTALFFPDRMHLSEAAALEQCRALVKQHLRFGGTLTINWHDRSMAPERNWDEFYRRLLSELERLTPWFARARDAVAWFAARRNIRFGRVRITENRATVSLEGLVPSTGDLPGFTLRILTPAGLRTDQSPDQARNERLAIDTPLKSHDHVISVELR